ncbi:GtrA family protein [Candidatus Falkowbacteria bacterium]|uniref:GtrA/DPMS transmembrane domain-containing protein n=1 Tax=Candidatus Falkowbacteria bacterium CG10_big_fil_rev_8_21_14_0_10_37_18 TaxID=1974562 RepID=A0A2H0V8I6_9BACT|nr:GtrA family protein [Candidatus Falkowbacteria bacterium]NCQ13090.1 GtrA family protein [Candidatus Falkowbacteria bacterium]OIO05715.1 MAG: hypothetical protein AUJ26_02520 [Candidatus Falkowbacteria bacterium CG1_02_37_21]PIR95416.1 MAG: hypothetical protein COT93_02495 [Candidatus Falkowbacteria bacterium CG10_big_fil_rev_8_21_14_0_10_37_18]
MFDSSSAYIKICLIFYQRAPRCYDLLNRHKGVVKFTIAGGLASVLDLVSLYLFHDPLGLDIVLSTTLAFMLSFILSFYLQKFWAFNDSSRHGKTAGQLFLYLLNALIGLNLNGFLMHFLVSYYQVWYLLSQVMVIALIGVLNFMVYKFIIFKKKSHETLG